jgi:hypothetical protein
VAGGVGREVRGGSLAHPKELDAPHAGRLTGILEKWEISLMGLGGKGKS